jgi:pilus assembly protein CpaF
MKSMPVRKTEGGAAPQKAGGIQAPPPVDDSSRSAVSREARLALQNDLYDRLLSLVSTRQLERLSEAELRSELRKLGTALCRDQAGSLDAADQELTVEQVVNEVFGFGPIDGLMRNHEISDILINGPRQMFIEKRGQLEATEVTFRDESHLLQTIGRLIAGTGRQLDVNSPMVDARLADGSRINAVMRPPALNGPLVSIRRFGLRPLTIEDLLDNESLTPEMLDFLSTCIRCRISIVISGGSGSGKTTLLNALSRYIPAAERVVTIEDTAELELQQLHVAKMEARPASPNGEGGVTMRELVHNSLRMRPDRIIVGECRGAEALEMLQAMNTGHEGSLTTIHANSTRDAIGRIELMIGLAGIDIPVWAISKLLASSIQIIVQVGRLVGGRRKILKISELTGMEGDTVSMHDLFEFVQTGVLGVDGAEGYFRATGLRPSCLNKLRSRGANLKPEMFAERRLDPAPPRERRS